eukprot:g3394.t1
MCRLLFVLGAILVAGANAKVSKARGGTQRNWNGRLYPTEFNGSSRFAEVRSGIREGGDATPKPPKKKVELAPEEPEFYKFMQMPINYNNEARPHKGSFVADEVKVGIDVLQVHSVDEKEGIAEADVFITATWTDPRLVDVAYTGFVAEEETGYPLWVPDLEVRDSSKSEILTSALWKGKKGFLRLTQKMSVAITLSLELWAYPFDRQIIDVKVADFRYGAADVVLMGYDPPGTLKMRANSGWTVLDWEVRSRKGPSIIAGGSEDSFATGHLIISREASSGLIGIILPLLVIVAFSFSALFVSSVDSFDTQLATASFGFLAVMGYIGVLDLPPVGYLLWLHWLVGLCFFSCLFITISIVMNHYQSVSFNEKNAMEASKMVYPKGCHPDTIAIEAEIAELFHKMDKNGSGYLDKTEVTKLAVKMGESKKTIPNFEKALSEMDPDGNGRITLKNFIDWHHRKHPMEPHHKIAEVKYQFDELDKDHDSFVTRKELRKLLLVTGNKTSGTFATTRYGKENLDFDTVYRKLDPMNYGKVLYGDFVEWHCFQNDIVLPEHDVEKGGSTTGTAGGKMEVATNRHHKITVDIETHIATLFQELDVDNSGFLDKSEVKNLAMQMGDKLTTMLSHSKLDKAFKEMDPDGDGKVSLEEFIAWHHRTHPVEPEHVFAQVQHLFNELDTDNSGYLDKREVKQMMAKTGNRITKRFSFNVSYGEKGKTFSQAFDEMDPSGDGKVSLSEFLEWHFNHHDISFDKDPKQEIQRLATKVEDEQKDRKVRDQRKKTMAIEKHIEDLFHELDVDNSGFLDKKEVKILARQMGDKLTTMLSHKKLDKAFAEMDPSGDGKVTLGEFIAWHHRNHPVEPHHVYIQVRYLFDELDKDHDGYIDKAEMKKLLSETGNKLTRRFSFHASYGEKGKSFEQAFKEMDPNEDGRVAFSEFLEWHFNHHDIEIPEMENGAPVVSDVTMKEFQVDRSLLTENKDSNGSGTSQQGSSKSNDETPPGLIRKREGKTTDNIDEKEQLLKPGVPSSEEGNDDEEEVVDDAARAEKELMAFIVKLSKATRVVAPLVFLFLWFVLCAWCAKYRADHYDELMGIATDGLKIKSPTVEELIHPETTNNPV